MGKRDPSVFGLCLASFSGESQHPRSEGQGSLPPPVVRTTPLGHLALSKPQDLPPISPVLLCLCFQDILIKTAQSHGETTKPLPGVGATCENHLWIWAGIHYAPTGIWLQVVRTQDVGVNYSNKVLLHPHIPFAKEMVPSGAPEVCRGLVHALSIFSPRCLFLLFPL